jgi:hypothetical protein
MFTYVAERSSLSWIREFFFKQTKSQTLIRLYLFWENRILGYPKSDNLVFAASDFGLDFFHLGSFIFLVIFHASKHLES